METPDLTLIHFCDAYHIEQRDKEPVGGSPRFKGAIDSFAHLKPLLVHSGDVYSPSLMSPVFRGKEMAAVLKILNPVCGVLGNHDLDYGLEDFKKLNKITPEMPWLCANVYDKTTNQPILGLKDRLLVDWRGIKVGIVGVVEEDWIVTLALDTSNFVSHDFVATATKISGELRAAGAQFVICLSHMRVPNDQKLAREGTGFDVILGGHDHFYHSEVVNGVPLVKSGTDFRWMSRVSVKFNNAEKNTKAVKATITSECIEITAKFPEDPALKALVDKFQSDIAAKLNKEIAYSEVQLDARVATVRAKESNLGNLIADAMRLEYNAEVCILNSGTIRSDDTYGPGPITIKDLVTILPFEDVTVVVKVTGKNLRLALENSVSQYPKHEGRFPQLSGLFILFDPSKPAGQRLIEVKVGDAKSSAPLDDAKEYKLATKPYILEGKDGYDSIKGSPFVVDLEQGQIISTIIRNDWKKLGIVEAWRRKATPTLMRAVDKLHHRTEERHRVIAPKLEGRIRIVGETEATAAN